MRTSAVLLLTMVTLSPVLAQEPPSILQITIERLKPGAEAQYAEVEERLAEMCARMGCPNAYLALESLGAPLEIWWLVMYESQADVDRVANAYAQNRPLLDALNALNALKKSLTETPIGYITKHRASSGVPWRVGGEPFAVIATAADTAGGSVFEADDGALFAIASAATRAEAEAAAAKLGPTARVFAARPAWSKPNDAWVSANPRLWTPR